MAGRAISVAAQVADEALPEQSSDGGKARLSSAADRRRDRPVAEAIAATRAGPRRKRSVC
jgi:hypothetical protein